jgi:mono/diheme cytochrome c family protein
MPSATTQRIRSIIAVVACSVLMLGCHLDMWDGSRLKPLEKSAFYGDGQSSRLPVAGTVPYKDPRLDTALYTGKLESGEFVNRIPVELDAALLERGELQFGIYCTPCHGAVGDGEGMIYYRGFPQPATYHIDRLRAAPDGYFFDVITNGFGKMYGYATRINPEDRWAVVAYVRTLQLSQNATLADVPAEARENLLNPAAAGADESHAETNGQH